jgi:2-polyprenyl-3-methyl-5-hydroxy-6-metoxy-1,4-benzoquinol methylase
MQGKVGLDIGCGAGAITLHVLERLGLVHVTGYDVEQPVIAAANMCAGDLGLAARAAFVQALPLARTMWKKIRTWEAMLAVLATGEHCPAHLRACKPK